MPRSVKTPLAQKDARRKFELTVLRPSDKHLNKIAKGVEKEVL